MKEEEKFEVGQTVYSNHDGKPRVVRRVSKSGQLAFGDPPYTSGSYRSSYPFTADRIAAQTQALRLQERQVPHAERRVQEAQDALAVAIEHLAWLKAQLDLNAQPVETPLDRG
jgi:hypothetical protein